MDGNALEVAIGLWRSPGWRAALRQRPLPDNVGLVIELAGGAPERLAQVSARTGERPDLLIDAARFYLREVLLFDGADAYRLLGVSPDTDVVQIKAHHRALQSWLHPDRRGGDWESLYAARVNAAWAQLRSPQRRAAYDSHHGGVDAGHAPVRVKVAHWQGDPTSAPRWAGWLALGTVAACCLWLAVLLDRKADMPAPEWLAEPQAAPGQSGMGTGRGTSRAGGTAAVTARANRAEHAGQAARANALEPPTPRPRRAVASTGAAASIGAAAVVAAPPARAARAAPTPVAFLRPPSRQATAAGPAPAQRNASAPVLKSPLAHAPRATLAIAPALPAPAGPRVTPTAPAPLPDIDPERVRRAARVGRDVMRYLASDLDHVPPVWRSVIAQDAAAALRERYRSRSIGRGRGRGARFGAPVWNIGQDRGTMRARIRPAGDDAGTTLRMDLSWREGRWLVDAIGTEAAP